MKILRRRRVGRPSTQPKATAALLDGTFRWLKLDDQARSFAAMRAFATAVSVMNPRMAEYVRAERLRGSILYIRCASSTWAQTLQMNKAQVVERVGRLPGGDAIRELRFNVGPLEDVVAWDKAQRTVDEPPAPRHVMPADVAAAVEAVADDELRLQLARLYGKLGSRKP